VLASVSASTCRFRFSSCFVIYSSCVCQASARPSFRRRHPLPSLNLRVQCLRPKLGCGEVDGWTSMLQGPAAPQLRARCRHPGIQSWGCAPRTASSPPGRAARRSPPSLPHRVRSATAPPYCGKASAVDSHNAIASLRGWVASWIATMSSGRCSWRPRRPPRPVRVAPCSLGLRQQASDQLGNVGLVGSGATRTELHVIGRVRVDVWPWL
jgi:hypothetical protein